MITKKEQLVGALQSKLAHQIALGITGQVSNPLPSRRFLLDDVPRHWAVQRLKFIVPAVTVGIVVTPAKYYVDSGVPCLRSLNISAGTISSDNLVYISADSNELHRKAQIYAGDIVIVRTGQPGTAAIVTAEFNGTNCIDLIIVRQSRQILPEFLHFFINSRTAIEQVQASTVGAIQGHYNVSTVADLKVPLPPQEEQRKIVDDLLAAKRLIEGLSGQVDSGIKRLREYRSALISAAVTGKIDVRHYREDAPCP